MDLLLKLLVVLIVLALLAYAWQTYIVAHVVAPFNWLIPVIVIIIVAFWLLASVGLLPGLRLMIMPFG